MIPADLRYTDQHEWIRLQGNAGTVGITDFAQNALGDLTFVELPAVGKTLGKGDEAVPVESCKAAAGVYCPADGKVTHVNSALSDDPGLINRDPYGEGWIFKLEIADLAQLSGLMDAKAYEAFCASQEK